MFEMTTLSRVRRGVFRVGVGFGVELDTTYSKVEMRG
jgi:hypothetical protein